jgi:hypothetical protein
MIIGIVSFAKPNPNSQEPRMYFKRPDMRYLLIDTNSVSKLQVLKVKTIITKIKSLY